MTDSLKTLFPLIFDSINEGVFTVDKDMAITSFNAEAERITGIARDEAIGRKCHEVLKASICQQGCAMRESIETGEPRRDVLVDVLNSDMEVVPIVVSTAVLSNQDGEMMGEMPTDQARKMAADAGLDLVEVAPDARPRRRRA